MSSSHDLRVGSHRCKECGERFSEPARRHNCRKSHGRFINAVSSGYFLEQRRRTSHPRCVGKFGLGLLEHPDPDVQEKKYEVRPTAARRRSEYPFKISLRHRVLMYERAGRYHFMLEYPLLALVSVGPLVGFD